MMILLPFLVFILLGFLLFFYFYGLVTALVLSSLIFLIILFLSFFAERIVLARVRAYKLPWYDPFLTLVGQEAHRLGFQHCPLVYETALLPYSVHYLESLLKKNYLLIGEHLRKELNENEMRALIVLALIRLKKDQGKNYFVIAFLMALISLPRSWGKHPAIKCFWDFFFFPLRQMMAFLFTSKSKIFLCDELAITHLGQNSDFISALYKLQTAKEGFLPSRFASFILPYFSLGTGTTKNVLKAFLGDGQFTVERYLKLTSSLRRGE